MEDVDRMEVLQSTTDAHTQRLDGSRREGHLIHVKELREGEEEEGGGGRGRIGVGKEVGKGEVR